MAASLTFNKDIVSEQRETGHKPNGISIERRLRLSVVSDLPAHLASLMWPKIRGIVGPRPSVTHAYCKSFRSTHHAE